MAVEDLTTYTEVDPNGHIGLTGTNQVDIAGLTMDESAYLYRAFDAVYDYTLRFTFNIDNATGNGHVVVGFGDVIGDVQASPSNFLCVMIAKGNMYFRRYNNGSTAPGADDVWSGPSTGTDYYVEVSRRWNDLSCRIYSDAAHTTLVQTLHIPDTGASNASIVSARSWSYFYAAQSNNLGVAISVTATLKDFELELLPRIEPTDVRRTGRRGRRHMIYAGDALY